MAHVPPQMARLAGAAHRSRPTHPKRRTEGQDVSGFAAQRSASEVAIRGRRQPVRGLGLRLVARIARAAGRLVIAR